MDSSLYEVRGASRHRGKAEDAGDSAPDGSDAAVAGDVADAGDIAPDGGSDVLADTGADAGADSGTAAGDAGLEDGGEAADAGEQTEEGEGGEQAPEDLTTFRETGGEQLDALWGETEADGLERAGTLARAPDGQLILVNPVTGDGTSVVPDLTVPEGHEFVGTFHTHPEGPDVLPGGFSEADIASAINSNEQYSLMRTGDQLFALERTADTPAFVDPTQLEGVFAESRAYWASQTNADGSSAFTDTDVLQLANLDVAERYGLTFYHGRAGEPLQRFH